MNKKILEFFLEQQDEEEVESEESEDPEAPEESEPETEEGGDDEESRNDQINNIGRIYELKKIYSLLLSLSNILDNFTDDKFDDIKKNMNKSEELFNLIISNLDKFEDKVDDVIIGYYKYIYRVVEEIEKLNNTKSKK